MAHLYVGSAHLGSSKAGATIAATVVDLTGVALPAQPTRNVIPLGGGVFGIHILDMPDDQAGWVVLKEGAAVLAALLVSPAETEPQAGSGGATAAEIATAVWDAAPAGTPLEDIAAAVWDAAPAGIPVEDIAAAVWEGAPAAIDATLVPTGLDAISTGLAGIPANFRERLVWLCCRHDDTTKTRVSETGSVILVRNLDGDPVTEQDVTATDTTITISNVRSPS